MNGRGKKAGDRCVVKVFRKCMGTKSLCSCEMKKSEKARELARAFNRSAHRRNVYLRFAATYWALMDEVSRLKTIFFTGERPLSSKEAVLFEDDVRFDSERPNKSRRLSNFMDSRGRHGTSRAIELDAFTHFTYHESGGQLVVCGLEGVHDSEGFFLKTPTIHSRAREFGNSDCGLRGMREVLGHHICNNVCKDMRKPFAEDDDCKKSENASTIAECATSGVVEALHQNSNMSVMALEACAINKPHSSLVNSKLPSISNIGDNCLDNRELPTAPEMLNEDQNFARSFSCPPINFPDVVGTRWTNQEFCPSEFIPIVTEHDSTFGPRYLYTQQNSLLNFSPTRSGRSGIDSAMTNVNNLHIEDENANLRRRVHAQCGNSKADRANRADSSLLTFDMLGAATSISTASHVDGKGSLNTSLTSGSLMSPGTTQRRPSFPRPLNLEHHNSHGCFKGDSGTLQPHNSIRQISTLSGEHCQPPHPCLPDNPPSYIDSQITTAFWVMQRGYGFFPHTSSHTPNSLWNQTPQLPGTTSEPYTDHQQ
ncbi:alpha-protein kinase vwka-like [Plakobranchus ocellatus]|uniref:Alpha-protein kinase vwka-like n=1 Tax=Plakobranchus ocellatus TaxID=259542 RepID=A0AAV4DAS4_9GAST|nr:alpha-protein kinase vwka-like [Plakobranchus ocellatus]